MLGYGRLERVPLSVYQVFLKRKRRVVLLTAQLSSAQLGFDGFCLGIMSRAGLSRSIAARLWRLWLGSALSRLSH